jgi:hypothetical protein
LPVTVAVPAGAAPVTVIEHVPVAVRVHVAGPVSPAVYTRFTVPDGVVAPAPAVSVTVTVHEID